MPDSARRGAGPVNEPVSRDELSQRYHEASAQDPRRPDPRVREAVRDHARMVIGARQRLQPHSGAPSPAPANQARWKVSMLASLALLGLTGLLVLQFDRGTPQEQEIVAGAPLAQRPAAPQAPAPALVAPAPTAARDTGASVSAAVAKSAPAVPGKAVPDPPAMERQAPGQADASPGVAARGVRKDQSAPSAPLADPPPSPAAGSGALSAAAPAKLADLSAANRAAPPSAELAVGLHEAARTGRLSELDRLLALGARIDATDASGRTALMLAVINDHPDTVRRLLGIGANAALRDREGLTALQHARRLGLERIAGLIETGS